MEAGRLRTVHSDWANTILVCKKCSKKLDGGFGSRGTTGLAKALREELGVRKGRKGALGIIDVKCLGICPKGAVTVVNGAAPGEWMLVREGLPIAAVVEELGLGASAPATIDTHPVRAEPVEGHFSENDRLVL